MEIRKGSVKKHVQYFRYRLPKKAKPTENFNLFHILYDIQRKYEIQSGKLSLFFFEIRNLH